ncbi:minor capsid protein [Clostridium lacusfryxellense]|uniref:minor capsid protein n=1 Tax=Clostridium lacusfryxellense TaxID=205328 RepID=UPI001C0B07BC|nr:minor capsid protein [Clostridium lacusfryxellense]MBU3112001.1 minor capsid protein [Clostridium lacusfryxellense]
MGVNINMNSTARILLAHHLNKNGTGQDFLTRACAKAFDNYVPFDTGRLKNMMITIDITKITYSAPYAKMQYYNNKGMGKQGESAGGKRGMYWDKRGFIDNRDMIIQTVANFVGGRKG